MTSDSPACHSHPYHSGWRFGAICGRSGVFPSDYVHPVAAPDFLVLPPDRVEPRDRQGRVAASAAIAVAMGSSVAAHEFDLSTEVRTPLESVPVKKHNACFKSHGGRKANTAKTANLTSFITAAATVCAIFHRIVWFHGNENRPWRIWHLVLICFPAAVAMCASPGHK